MSGEIFIDIQRAEKSRIDEVDLQNLSFGKEFTDHMFVADYVDGKWQNFRIEPLRAIPTHPGNLAWHYGQSIFEGMKATKNPQGEVLLFRPDMHIKRFNTSARRMCMPEFPEEVFLKALKVLVELEKHWIPNDKDAALYIRPLMIAWDPHLGVKPSQSYKFFIMTLPVGPYYNKPLNILVQTQYIRAVEGGVGFAKTAGNYAASLYPTQLAQQQGFDQVLWMEPKDFRFVQEVGTMNIFFVLKDRILTPRLTGAILPGITRDSIIHILRDWGHDVREEKVDILDLVRAYERGDFVECFGSGTAAVIANVQKLRYRDIDMYFPPDQWQLSLQLKDYLTQLKRGEVDDKYHWTVKTTGALNQLVHANDA